MSDWWSADPVAGNITVKSTVPSTSKVWGDQEAQAAGLYEGGDNWWQADPTQADAKPQPGVAVERKGPAGPDVSVSEAAGRGVAQGATFNFYDELRGLMEAGGLDPNEPASLNTLLSGAYKYWSGDKEAEGRYDSAVNRERIATKQTQEQQPVASFGGNVVGAVALPMGAALNATTLPGRIGRGAAVGAGTGAAFSAGEGEGAADRLSRAATGAAVGAGVGAAAPPILAGIGAAGRTISEPVRNMVRGLRDPEAEAARRVVTGLQRDAQAGSSGMAPAEFVAARSEGAPVANIDMGGEVTRALGRSAANTSPEARSALERVTSDRFGSQGERAMDLVQGLVRTPANATMTREALEDAARTYRKPFYDRAYRDGSQGIFDDELMAMTQSPAMEAAMKAAGDSIRNKEATGRAMNVMGANGQPTLVYWDQVKRNLDSAYNVLKRQGDTEAMADVDALRKTLIRKLDDAVPSYATARGVASEFFKASDAVEAGEKFVRMNTGLGESRKAIAKMGPEERILFAEGFASKLLDDLKAVPDRRNVVNKIAGTKLAREKIEIALGKNGMEKVEAFILRENIMDRARGAISGNSTTARQLIEAGLAGGAYGLATGNVMDPKNLLVAALTFGARRGQMKIDQRVAQKVGEMLASNDPRVLQKGVNMVINNKSLMQALRGADDYVAKIGGQQSTGVPALQSMGTGRAEDEPNVPGPRR